MKTRPGSKTAWHGQQAPHLRGPKRSLRKGTAPMQAVLILGVCLIVLLGLLRIWNGGNGSGGMKDDVRNQIQTVLAGGDENTIDRPNPPKPPDDSNSSNKEDPPVDPPVKEELSDDVRRRIAQLEADARRLSGQANLAAILGQSGQSKTFQAMSDAALLEAAYLRGPEFLKTEIAAIAARRSVEVTAEALLKAIEKRVPIARVVTLPIVDGLGQLTGDFIHWWRSMQ